MSGRIKLGNNCIACEQKTTRVFSLPINDEMRKKWLTLLKREDLNDLDSQYVANNGRVCVNHFQDWAFTNTNKQRLVRFALPESGPPPALPIIVQEVRPLEFKKIVKKPVGLGMSMKGKKVFRQFALKKEPEKPVEPTVSIEGSESRPIIKEEPLSDDEYSQTLSSTTVHGSRKSLTKLTHSLELPSSLTPHSEPPRHDTVKRLTEVTASKEPLSEDEYSQTLSSMTVHGSLMSLTKLTHSLNLPSASNPHSEPPRLDTMKRLTKVSQALEPPSSLKKLIQLTQSVTVPNLQYRYYASPSTTNVQVEQPSSTNQRSEPRSLLKTNAEVSQALERPSSPNLPTSQKRFKIIKIAPPVKVPNVPNQCSELPKTTNGQVEQLSSMNQHSEPRSSINTSSTSAQMHSKPSTSASLPIPNRDSESPNSRNEQESLTAYLTAREKILKSINVHGKPSSSKEVIDELLRLKYSSSTNSKNIQSKPPSSASLIIKNSKPSSSTATTNEHDIPPSSSKRCNKPSKRSHNSPTRNDKTAKLQEKVQEQQKTIYNQRSYISKLKKQIQILRSENLKFQTKVMDKLNTERFSFLKSLIRQLAYNKYGAKWTEKDKEFASACYMLSPKVYKMLRYKLGFPSKATLLRQKRIDQAANQVDQQEDVSEVEDSAVGENQMDQQEDVSEVEDSAENQMDESAVDENQQSHQETFDENHQLHESGDVSEMEDSVVDENRMGGPEENFDENDQTVPENQPVVVEDTLQERDSNGPFCHFFRLLQTAMNETS